MTPDDRIDALQREVVWLRERMERFEERVEVALDKMQETCDAHREESRKRTDALRDSVHSDALKIRNVVLGFIGAMFLAVLPVVLLAVLG